MAGGGLGAGALRLGGAFFWGRPDAGGCRIPAFAGMTVRRGWWVALGFRFRGMAWIPAFAGMTVRRGWWLCWILAFGGMAGCAGLVVALDFRFRGNGRVRRAGGALGFRFGVNTGAIAGRGLAWIPAFAGMTGGAGCRGRRVALGFRFSGEWWGRPGVVVGLAAVS